MKVSIERDVTVTLTLAEREAQVLATILTWVGGSTSGPRGVLDELLNVLADVDIGGGAIKRTNAIGIDLPDTWEEFLV